GAGLDRGDVAGKVQAAQLLFGDPGVALILAAKRAAVAQEVLRAGHDARGVDGGAGVHAVTDVVLKPAHRGRAQALGQLGRLAVTLVGAAPAFISDHRDARRERPVDAGARDLARGHARRRLHGLGAARAAEADVVGKDRRPLEAAVAVDRV